MNAALHFAHGNGFPALCYSQLLGALEKNYACHYLERIGHNPQFPVTDNWQNLVDELIQSVQNVQTIHSQRESMNTSNQPVVGVGHSLGGGLTLLAANKHPELFKAVIMIDSPVLNRVKSSLVRIAKSIGVIDHITPAHASRRRRQHWHSREALFHYLIKKPLFKTFTEACLQDFIDCGVEQSESGYKLRFDPNIEYAIYRTIPHDLPAHLKTLPFPVILIYGDKSTVVSRFDVQYMHQRYNIQCIKMKGTHMLPMECPELLAKTIYKALNSVQ